MMTKIIFLYAILLSFSLSARTWDDCHYEFMENGESPVTNLCIAKLQQIAPKLARYEAEGLLILAYDNALIVERNQRIYVHSGDQTQLSDIIALDYDPDKAEIYTLNQWGDVLVIDATLLGNVAPIRTIKDKLHANSTDIAYGAGQVYLLNKEMQRIIVYAREADSSSRRGKAAFLSRKDIAAKGSVEEIRFIEGKLEQLP